MKKGLSLRGRILLPFICLDILTVVVFFLMNYVFWNYNYMKSARSSIMEAYDQLSMMERDELVTEDEMLQVITSVKRQNISFALQGASDWDFLVITRKMISPFERDFLLERLQMNLLQSSADNVRVLQTGDHYILQEADLQEAGRYLECYGYMKDVNGDMKKFIFSLPLSNVYQAFAASNVFFLYTSMVLMAAGCIAIVLATQKLTKPILQLREISQKMSHLDFSVRYTGKANDEIGILGNNMNEMSSQLERTIRRLQMANETLQKDLEEKNQVDEMRKDFISNVSHELKTPIALIQGYAEGLKEWGDDPETYSYYCDVIMDEAEKMNKMVRKLTTLNQLEFGKDELQIEAFDIMDMIRSLVNNSRKMQEDSGAEVTVKGPQSLLVFGDEFKIEEVINNYYSNAFNHLKDPKKIEFFLDDLGPNVRISVRNTGENIPTEELDKIWIKFYKVDKARTRAYGGSGIGLSIVKAIMDAHHQEFGVYNEEGAVVFWFELEKAEAEGRDDGSYYGGMGKGIEA